MSKQLQLSRHQFLAYTVASSTALLIPNIAPAASFKITDLMRLHPVRFIAGLIFSIARSVVVRMASDYLVTTLRQQVITGHKANQLYGNKIVSCSGNDCQDNGNQFKHVNYKASVITLGVADYREHEQRQLALLLQSEPQTARFQATLDYLRDEKIRIALAGMEYSQKVGLDTEPDDLFSIDYLKMNAHQSDHYHNLIQHTGTNAFKQWSV